MGDHDQSTLCVFQKVFQPFRHRTVKVVGRLVKDQDIRWCQQGAYKGDPLALSTGKLCDILGQLRDAKLCQH